MLYRAVQAIHYWIDYAGSAALLVTGTALIHRGDLAGIPLVIIAAAPLLAAVAGERSKKPRGPALDERVPVPSIQDDGSLR